MVFAPATYAWGGATHRNIATAVYNHLPNNVKANLNLDIMKNSSRDPDLKFKDYENHIYPGSVSKAKEWLNKGKQAYAAGKYNAASYDFGVASHYIADTGCAPHCVTGEGNLHAVYETQANKLTPAISFLDVIHPSDSIKTMLENENGFGTCDWNIWIDYGRTDDAIQDNLNYATSIAYVLIKKYI